MIKVHMDADKAEAFATALCEYMRDVRESSHAEEPEAQDTEPEEERFLFPDEIREILRDCDDETRIGIYDVSNGEWSEVFSYEVWKTQNRVKYQTRYGVSISEENLAMKIYDFIEDGYTVTINGTDIFEGWE